MLSPGLFHNSSWEAESVLPTSQYKITEMILDHKHTDKTFWDDSVLTEDTRLHSQIDPTLFHLKQKCFGFSIVFQVFFQTKEHLFYGCGGHRGILPLIQFFILFFLHKIS